MVCGSIYDTSEKIEVVIVFLSKLLILEVLDLQNNFEDSTEGSSMSRTQVPTWLTSHIIMVHLSQYLNLLDIITQVYTCFLIYLFLQSILFLF